MALQWIWFGMMAASIIYTFFFGRAPDMLSAALEGTAHSIQLTINLGAGYLLFCGLIEIVKALGVPQKLDKGLRPLMRRLMPGTQSDQTREAVALNLSMNLLGLGNAATPMGIEAMRRMDAERRVSSRVEDDMYMLLILNATSIQLLPTTVLALRVAAGSAIPNAILLPGLLCTTVSTIVGTVAGVVCRRIREARG